MSILAQVSVLALKPLVEGACQSLGVEGAVTVTQTITDFLIQRFTDHSQRLTSALRQANTQAWHAIEIALAGDSWWDRVKARLASGDDKALREQIRSFLEATPLGNLPGHGPEFRAVCLANLRAARKQGVLLEGDLHMDRLAHQAGALARFGSPDSLVRAEAELLAGLASDIRSAGFSALAEFLELRPLQNASVLAVTVRYFFRRQVETDAALFQGLAFAQLERLDKKQEVGFAALHDALGQRGTQLQDLLGEVGSVVRETHTDVKEMKDALARHGQQLQAVGQVVLRALTQPTPAPAAPAMPARKEQDVRLEMLNALLTTPHRRIDLVWPLHQQLIEKDPRSSCSWPSGITTRAKSAITRKHSSSPFFSASSTATATSAWPCCARCRRINWSGWSISFTAARRRAESW
jgi:hypothetical protein